MKKYCFMLLTVLLLSTLESFSDNSKSYLGFDVGLGYSKINTLNWSSKSNLDLKNYGSFGFNTNITFEYYRDHTKGFWCSGMLGFKYMMGSSAFDGLNDFTLRIVDTRGIETNCHYTNFSALEETQFLLLLNLKGQAGYHKTSQRSNHRGFYFCGGLEFVFGGLLGHANTTYWTSATYDQYIDDFEKMDDHYYTSHNVSNTNSIKNVSSFGLLGSFEIGGYYKASVNGGGTLGTKGTLQLIKIGFFIESGAMCLYFPDSKGNYIGMLDGKPIFFEKPTASSDATELKPLSYWQANYSGPQIYVPLYTGVRISFLFSPFCKNCRQKNYHGRSN